MTPLFIILYIVVGAFGFAGAITIGAMVMAGQIAIRGTDAYRLKHAENQKKIAEFEFQRTQTELNRQIMEAKGVEELARLHDAHFARQLEAGRRT